MKIAFISLMKILPWGGSEELWYKAAKLALANGHTVTTLTQKWSETPAKIGELQQLGADAQFFYVADYPSSIERLAIRLRLRQQVAEVVPIIDADVYVISNGSVFDFIHHQQTIKYVLDSGKPYIMVSQHNFENGNVVTTSHHDYAVKVARNAAKFFFVSARNLLNAERQLSYYLPNAEVINNPLNIRDIAIKPFPEGETLLMACVARLDCAFKGQDILLQVLSTEPWTSRDYHLRLYGSGPHREYLQRLIELYDLQAKVTIAGHVHNVDQIWQDNQVLVLPSLSEGTPLALVEAMLSGRAVVTTDVGDNGEYVQNGITGFLAPVASVTCIAAVLEQLWKCRSDLPAMGEKAFGRALDITDLQPEVKLLKFIESI